MPAPARGLLVSTDQINRSCLLVYRDLEGTTPCQGPVYCRRHQLLEAPGFVTSGLATACNADQAEEAGTEQPDGSRDRNCSNVKDASSNIGAPPPAPGSKSPVISTMRAIVAPAGTAAPRTPIFVPDVSDRGTRQQWMTEGRRNRHRHLSTHTGESNHSILTAATWPAPIGSISVVHGPKQ